MGGGVELVRVTMGKRGVGRVRGGVGVGVSEDKWERESEGEVKSEDE